MEVLLLFQTCDGQSHADLWSLVKCLNQKGVVLVSQNAVKQGCVMLHNALDVICIWEAILTVMVR